MTSLGDLGTTGRMLVVTGKGGVGKSAVAAALGRSLALAGQRVLLVEIDPRESLYQLLSAAPSGGEVVEVPLDQGEQRGGSHGGLSLQNLQPKRVIEQMVREQIRVEMIARRLVSSSVFQHFIESAPGLKEMAVLAYAMRALPRGEGSSAGAASEDERGQASGREAKQDQIFDTIVLDAPATGHGVSLLSAPRVVAQVIQHGPFGRMAREMTAFVADPSRVGLVVVTKAEEAPAQETIELFARLQERVQRTPELLVVNGLYPALPRALPPAAALSLPLRGWVEHRRTNDRELAGLRALDVPIVELPLLPIDPGPELVTALGERVVRALDIAANAA